MSEVKLVMVSMAVLLHNLAFVDIFSDRFEAADDRLDEACYETVKDVWDERFEPEDRKTLEKVARYLLRPPLSLERMTLTYAKGADQVVYRREGRDERLGEEQRVEALDFLARVIANIPPPKVHLVRYQGHYSNVSRCRRRKGESGLVSFEWFSRLGRWCVQYVAAR